MIFEGRPFTIVGVLPASNRSLMGFGFTPEVYVPPLKNDGDTQVRHAEPGRHRRY
jgi:hypothetical protein